MESQTKNTFDQLINSDEWSMNTLNILMTYAYVSKLCNLNWNDILFAIKNGFLSHQSAIDHAVEELSKENDTPKEVIDIACLSPEEAIYQHSIYPFIDELAEKTPNQEKDKTKDKIMYVLLNWIFEHKDRYTNPLEVVEFVYDDFGFPEEISSFVRYMPSKEPALPTVEMNIERLYTNWKSYLDSKKAIYSEQSK